MTKVTPSDVLRLSGLFDSCNILNLHSFVGRIRRSRRIRREQSTFSHKPICANYYFFQKSSKTVIGGRRLCSVFRYQFSIVLATCSGTFFLPDSRRYCHRSRRVPLHLAVKGDHLQDRPLALSYKGVPGNLMPPVTVYPDVC